MNKYIPVTVLFLLSALSARTVFSQDKKVKQIDSLIDRAYDLGLFNGNLLVAEQDNIIYKASMGFAEAASKNRLDDQYRFCVGPVAREFNTIAIMLLEEDGKLKLDDKVSSYLSDLPGWAGKISIKNLLQSSSGLPDAKSRSGQNDDENFSDLKKITTINFEPGAQYHHTIYNDLLQRKVIEKITGGSFNAFVLERMFKPSGITNSLLVPANKDLWIAKAYNNEHVEDPYPFPSSNLVFLTVDDLFKWSQSLQQFHLIKPGSLKRLLSLLEKDKQSALGKSTMLGDKMIMHTHGGDIGNYQTLLASNVPKGRTVVLMSNNKNMNLYDLNAAIQAILDDKPWQMPKKSVFQKIEKQLNALNGQQIIAFYEYLKVHNTQDYGFENESELNSIGYFLLEKSRFEDAIIVFEHNAKIFPKSGKVFDGLGEAYYIKGDRKNALVNYKKSLQSDPLNKMAKERIIELEKPVIEKTNAKATKKQPPKN